MAARKNTELREGMVSVTVPRANGNEDPNLFISINGVNYLIPRGKTSVVPAAVAEEYYRSERAKDKFYETAESLSSKQ